VHYKLFWNLGNRSSILPTPVSTQRSVMLAITLATMVSFLPRHTHNWPPRMQKFVCVLYIILQEKHLIRYTANLWGWGCSFLCKSWDPMARVVWDYIMTITNRISPERSSCGLVLLVATSTPVRNTRLIQNDFLYPVPHFWVWGLEVQGLIPVQSSSHVIRGDSLRRCWFSPRVLSSVFNIILNLNL